MAKLQNVHELTPAQLSVIAGLNQLGTVVVLNTKHANGKTGTADYREFSKDITFDFSDVTEKESAEIFCALLTSALLVKYRARHFHGKPSEFLPENVFVGELLAPDKKSVGLPLPQAEIGLYRTLLAVRGNNPDPAMIAMFMVNMFIGSENVTLIDLVDKMRRYELVSGRLIQGDKDSKPLLSTEDVFTWSNSKTGQATGNELEAKAAAKKMAQAVAAATGSADALTAAEVAALPPNQKDENGEPII